MPIAAKTVFKILDRWRKSSHPSLENEPEFSRRSLPDATMNLILRFETELGPRTIVASRIPLGVASLIANTMIGAGQYAEVTDEFPQVTMAERIKRLKSQKARAAREGSALAVVR